MTKMNRNALCGCGSQKKSKICCLKKMDSIPSVEFDIEWQQVRQTEGRLYEKAFDFAQERWGKEIIEDAWDAFCLDVDLDQESNEGVQLFPNWYIFRWIPFDYSVKWKHLGPNRTIAEIYHQEYPNRVEASFLAALQTSQFSFFLVEDVIPSKRIVLKDLLLDRTVTIRERAAADPVFKGYVFYGRVITVGDVSIQISFGSAPLPTGYAMSILDIKHKIVKFEGEISNETLLKYDDDLRQFYFDSAHSARQPVRVYNKDGEPIMFCTLHYSLNCTPKEAFKKLAPLCKGETPSKLLKEGEFNSAQELTSIIFPWLKSRSDHLILGDIKINDNDLTVFVNSIERSEKIKIEISKRLPIATFKNMATESMEKMKERESAPLPEPSMKDKTAIKKYLHQYYQDWMDMSLPALNGKTPREAAKTVEGREKVELLLFDFETKNQKTEDHLKVDVERLRRELLT